MQGNFKITAILLMSILFMGSCYSQNKLLVDIEKGIDAQKYELVKASLDKINPSSLKNDEKAKYYYLKALYFDNTNVEDSSYNYYQTAKKIYKSIDSIDMEMSINLKIAALISSQENNHNKYREYMNEYIQYAFKKKDSSKIANAYSATANYNYDNNDYNGAIKSLKTALLYVPKNNQDQEINISNNIASLYINLQKPDSGLHYLKKNLDLLSVKKNNANEIAVNYINQAAAYHSLKDFKKAIRYLKIADSIPIKNHQLKTKQYIYEFLSINYDSLKDYKNAYLYLELSTELADSANVIQQNIAINDIQTKYQTREKELENEVLTGKVKKKNILVYIAVGLLIASLIIGFLIVKNARRREHISKQEKLIEQQKLEKALKEYELSSIDIMLEGQEKERQRIANDLHDNLGSMLATLKMNFEHLRLRKNELREEENKLYDRTDELIEEAYQKVRRLAHAKNAGVFANEGLIPTIRKMAEKISIPGKLSIEVMAVGFNKRLENTIEIAIFRMVQELSTNIIKHSQATEASIQLTNHDENINIIIEDNGVGFPSAKTHTSDGMGLNTIRKKVEQLGGTFTIDSTQGKGTTIIIDLPI